MNSKILPVIFFCFTASSCGNYARLLGYGALPPSTDFSMYDPHFATTQADRLANSRLVIGDIYFNKFVFESPNAKSQRTYRPLLRHFNWGPFYAPSASETPNPVNQIILYECIKFYKDGRVATFLVDNPTARAFLSEPVDNVGYFVLHGDTAVYELSSRLAPGKRLTGLFIFYNDSLLNIPSVIPTKKTLAPRVFYRYHL